MTDINPTLEGQRIDVAERRRERVSTNRPQQQPSQVVSSPVIDTRIKDAQDLATVRAELADHSNSTRRNDKYHLLAQKLSGQAESRFAYRDEESGLLRIMRKADLIGNTLRRINVGRVERGLGNLLEEEIGTPDQLYNPLITILHFGNARQQEQAFAVVTQMAESSDAQRSLLAKSALPLFHQAKTEGVMNHAQEQTATLLTNLGLDSEKILDRWERGASAYENIALFADNMRVALQLESAVPGGQVAKTLVDEFGIHNFARYPLDILVKQFKEKDAPGPYGVTIMGVDDYNGSTYNAPLPYQRIFDQIQGNMNLRIYEVEGRDSFVNTIASAAEKNGKISFAIIDAHGSSDGISFSDEHADLTIHDLKYSKNAERITAAFVDHPTVILNSCNTGNVKRESSDSYRRRRERAGEKRVRWKVDPGFAEELSRGFNAEVIAPNLSTSLQDLDIQFDAAGRPRFTALYEDDDGNASKDTYYRYDKGEIVWKDQ